MDEKREAFNARIDAMREQDLRWSMDAARRRDEGMRQLFAMVFFLSVVWCALLWLWGVTK